jgi:hypothetical protein
MLSDLQKENADAPNTRRMANQLGLQDLLARRSSEAE